MNTFAQLLLRLVRRDAITLPPWGIFFRTGFIDDPRMPRLWRHEYAHWRQYKRMGAVRFYATYLWQLIRYGYENHPMEIEARNAENQRV